HRVGRERCAPLDVVEDGADFREVLTESPLRGEIQDVVHGSIDHSGVAYASFSTKKRRSDRNDRAFSHDQNLSIYARVFRRSSISFSEPNGGAEATATVQNTRAACPSLAF